MYKYSKNLISQLAKLRKIDVAYNVYALDFVPITFKSTMCAEKLANIPEVEIDPEGTFKYVLIKIYGSQKSSDAQDVKLIVRGFKSGKFHD